MHGSLWHLTFAAERRFPFFTTEAQVRLAVRRIGEMVGTRTLMFNLVDEHIHLLLETTRQDAGRVGRVLRLTLKPILSNPLDSARISPVKDKYHLRNLVDYLLGQTVKHRLPVHPAIWQGSCFLDLIDVRLAGVIGVPLSKYLPRLNADDIWRAAKLTQTQISPFSDREVFAAGAGSLVLAVARVTATDDQLSGRRIHCYRARVLAVHMARRAGISNKIISVAMQTCPKTILRLLHAPPPAKRGTDAVRLLMGIQRESQMFELPWVQSLPHQHLQQP